MMLLGSEFFYLISDRLLSLVSVSLSLIFDSVLMIEICILVCILVSIFMCIFSGKLCYKCICCFIGNVFKIRVIEFLFKLFFIILLSRWVCLDFLVVVINLIC